MRSVLAVRVVAMQFPIRVILALFVIGAFAGIGVWGIVAVLRANSMTQSQRAMRQRNCDRRGGAARVGHLRVAGLLGLAFTSPSDRAGPRCRGVAVAWSLLSLDMPVESRRKESQHPRIEQDAPKPIASVAHLYERSPPFVREFGRMSAKRITKTLGQAFICQQLFAEAYATLDQPAGEQIDVDDPLPAYNDPQVLAIVIVERFRCSHISDDEGR